MDTATIIALINLGGLVFAIYQLSRQRKDTEHLAHVTSNLDHRVHRLATSLDQRITRLNRVTDLIIGLLHVTHALKQQSRSHPDKLDTAVKLNMTMPELEALINTIGDGDLHKLFQQLSAIINNEIWPLTWNNEPFDMGAVDQLLIQQSGITRQMHQRVLKLLEDTTHIEENS